MEGQIKTKIVEIGYVWTPKSWDRNIKTKLEKDIWDHENGFPAQITYIS